MTQPVLVVGHRGILGRALLAELSARGVAVQGADVAEMDIADASRVRAVVGQVRPRVVVNCAAFTKVDTCEVERELCFAANARGAGNVAAAAAAVGARLVHISTDYVFDGAADTPYREEALPGPLSVYGESKLVGEWRVASAHRNHLIVRTAWLFGVGGVNFISKILTTAKSGEPLSVVDDQRGSPTYAGHLAAAIANLLDVEYRGVVHVAGSGVASWFDVAGEVLRLTGLAVPLRPISTASLELPAPRPAFSALDTTRYTFLTGRTVPPWQEGVAAYLREIRELLSDAG